MIVALFGQNGRSVVKCGIAEDVQNFRSKLRINRSKALQGSFQHISPLGKFKINYELDGDNKVPEEDLNQNNVPDYVEKIAIYLDESYTKLVSRAGFTDPIESIYSVFFSSSPSYGSTWVEGNKTYIRLHNNFRDFPKNDDAVNWEGAAKVTCAHELKHAIQFKTSRWAEAVSWSELDATWAEEFVYPHVNDFHNYLEMSKSQIISPYVSLAGTRNASVGYGNSLFQLYLSSQLSESFFVELWELRQQNPLKKYIETIEMLLKQKQKRLNKEFHAYSKRLFFTGNRLQSFETFNESDKMPTSSTKKRSLSLSEETEELIAPLGSERFEISFDIPETKGFPIFSLTRFSEDVQITLIIEGKDGSYYEQALTPSSDFLIDYQSPRMFYQIKKAYLIVSNSSKDAYESVFLRIDKSREVALEEAVEFITNPVQYQLELSLNQAFPRVNIHVFNILGQKVISYTKSNQNQPIQIDMRRFSSGIYFVQIQYKYDVRVFRIVKL